MHKTKSFIFILSFVLVVLAAFKTSNIQKKSKECYYAMGLKEAIKCASIAEQIMAYNEEWPDNMNSTLFFKLIEGNKKLTSLSFCYIYIDSLTTSIAKVPNLKDLQLTRGNIIKIPKEIGRLKKLEELAFGKSTDECGGNKIRFIPKEIGNCSSLRYLGLAYSEISDLPNELKKCKKLSLIDLSFNKNISDSLLEEFKRRFPKVTFICERN